MAKNLKADIEITDAKIQIKGNISNEQDSSSRTFKEFLMCKTCQNYSCQKKEPWLEKEARCAKMRCKECSECTNCTNAHNVKREELRKCLLTQYLNHVVPEWRYMEEDRLYKHIQRTLDNAEQIRRFEIELVWKRSVYMVGLLLITFTGFAWTAQSVNQELPTVLQEFLLFTLAIVNTIFSFCFWKINLESRFWQRNWECHADYLQELVGAGMMRTLFRKENYFSIGKINTFMGAFLTLSCIFVLFVIMYYQHWIDQNCLLNLPTCMREKWKCYIFIIFVAIAIISCLINFAFDKCTIPSEGKFFKKGKKKKLPVIDFNRIR